MEIDSYTRTCHTCGKRFEAKHGLERYCSAYCRRVARAKNVMDCRARKVRKEVQGD